MNFRDRLFELKDDKNADFQRKLTPGVPEDKFLGVRVPAARNLAKEIMKDYNRKPSKKLSGYEANEEIKFIQERTAEIDEFFQALPHEYFDENMLHGVMISALKDYDKAVSLVDAFLPYVDNWAVCDSMSPKIFKKHRAEFIEVVKRWAASDETYTCRFGIGMLMEHYLDEDFKAEYLEIPASIHSEEYYVRMMQAWYYATALAKQWDATIPYLVENKLDAWVHNKTIQKARESYRITPEQKEYLKTLKR